MANIMCSIFGHKYITEFGSPYTFTKNLSDEFKATVTVGALVCSRCGAYQIAPHLAVNLVDDSETIVKPTTRGKKNG